MVKNKYPSFLRCYGRPDGDGYLAVCLELFLVVKGASLEEAKSKLIEQIKSYLECIDEKNFRDLFPRMAPLQYRLDYNRVRALIAADRFRHALRNRYECFLEELRPSKLQLILAI